MNRSWTFLWAILLSFGGLAAAQEAPTAPEPSFELLGNVTQKLTVAAPAWGEVATSTWGFTASLRPQFSYGPVRFVADSAWSLPITASLTAVAPTVAVSEAYFRWSASDVLDLTFGQKRLPIGVGQTFTVGDSINPVIGFFDQKTGFRGATAEWSPVSWASWSAGISTEGGRADNVAGATQVSLLLGGVQATASLVARKDITFNPSLGVSYDVLGVILTAEGAAEFLPQGVRPTSAALATWTRPEAWSDPALSASAGARWTVTLWDADFTVAGEYLHWAQGWNRDETTGWKAAYAAAPTKAAAGAIRAALPLRSQDNAFFRFLIAVGTEYSLSSFAAVDLQDQSVMGQLSLSWVPWDNLECGATLQTSGGEAGSSWEFFNPAKDRYQGSISTTYHY